MGGPGRTEGRPLSWESLIGPSPGQSTFPPNAEVKTNIAQRLNDNKALSKTPPAKGSVSTDPATKKSASEKAKGFFKSAFQLGKGIACTVAAQTISPFLAIGNTSGPNKLLAFLYHEASEAFKKVGGEKQEDDDEITCADFSDNSTAPTSFEDQKNAWVAQGDSFKADTSKKAEKPSTGSSQQSSRSEADDARLKAEQKAKKETAEKYGYNTDIIDNE